MRARAVIDGQQVEIPVLRIIRTVGTQEDRKTGEWKNPAKYKGVSNRQIRCYKLKYEWERRKVAKFLNCLLYTSVADSEPVVDLTLSSCGKDFDFTCVSMGNPHAVTFIDTPVKEFEVEKYGPSLEVDSHFPRKANIEFVEIVDETHLKMRVWERGTGETLACGTGTCATVVASNIKGICPRVPVEVELVGGKLTIEWKPEDNHVYMTGPATFVFDGVWED